MKKIVSLILVLTIMMSLCAPLAGCSSITPMQMGTWLSLIAESFGMSEYSTSEPYFANVNPGDTYFGAFQMAAEWEILEPNATVTSQTDVKWKDALITLVNAGNFLGAEATDDEKIAYAIETFDPEIRTYWMDRNIKMSEAVPLLDKAVDLWVNREFTERIEERSFSEEVVDLIDTEDLEYQVEGNTVRIDADKVKDLKPGDVYTLPGVENETGSSINKVESVEIEGDTAIITNKEDCDVAEMFSQIEEIREQSTEMIDFSQIGAIYDAYGNVLYSNENGINYDLAEVSYDQGEDNVYISNLVDHGDHVDADQLGFFKGGALSFTVDGVKIKVSISGSGISVTLSEETWSKGNASREAKNTVFVTGGISDVKLTKDIDYSWGKLHSAMVKVDYTTKIGGGVKGELESNVGSYLSGEDYKSIKSLSTVIAGYKDAISRMGKDLRQRDTQKDLYICRIAIPCLSNGIWGVDFIVKGSISVSGQLQVEVTMEGAKGVEYKNGNVRFIKENSKSLDLAAEAEAEVTISAGLELAILTYTAVQLTIDAGIGGKIEYTAHVVDAEFHLINTGPMTVPMALAGGLEVAQMTTSSEDILALAESEGGTWKAFVPGAPVVLSIKSCVDWKIYPILKVSASIPFLKSKPGGSIEISGSKNEKFIIKGHIHFPNNIVSALSAGSVGKGFMAALGIGKTCDYEFTPWDETAEETTEATETTETVNNSGLDTTEVIAVASQRLFLDAGESEYIKITGLPVGYTLDDIVAKSENTAIATVTNDGKVTAGERDGTVTIIISTSDGKYTSTVAITVNPAGPGSFVGLVALV